MEEPVMTDAQRDELKTFLIKRMCQTSRVRC